MRRLVLVRVKRWMNERVRILATVAVVATAIWLVLLCVGCYSYEEMQRMKTKKANQLYQVMQEKKVGQIVLVDRDEKWLYRPDWLWPPSWSPWEKGVIGEEERAAITAKIVACFREEGLWSDAGGGLTLVATRSTTQEHTMTTSETDDFGGETYDGVYGTFGGRTYWEFRVKSGIGGGVAFKEHSLVEKLRRVIETP